LKYFPKLIIVLSRYIYITLAVVFIFFNSCATNPVTGESELMLVSESQELKIGRDAAPSVKWDFGGTYNDSSLHPYLEGIVKRIWANSERPHLPVKFYIQNSSIPNAFALPGYVAITRGLLSDLQNEAQFAAIMGHEVGHVMARHTAQRLSRGMLQQLGLVVGAAALEGKGGSDALLTIGAVGSSLFLLKYDRAQEIQADRLGVKYMAKLGYDPEEAVSAHQVLEKSVNNYMKRQGTSRNNDSFMSNLLSTHPRQEVRISEIQSMINSLPPSDLKGARHSDIFQNATHDIKDKNKIYFIYDKAYAYYQKKDYRKAEDTIAKAIKKDSSQAPFHSLSGFIKLQMKSYDSAYNTHKKALSIDPDYQPSIFGTGLVYFFEMDYEKAITEFKKSLSLNPAHAPTHFALGKSYIQTKQYGKAIPYLRNFAGAAPKNPEIHGLLGICYDNTREIRSAVIEYRNQLAVAPKTELGNHARQRLAVLEPMLKK
jgi:predicted Zn-dependent protease